jgi:hypothetical protein
METLLDTGIVLLIGLYLIYRLAGLPFYDDTYRPGGRGFLGFLLTLVGLAWLLGDGDDGDC